MIIVACMHAKLSVAIICGARADSHDDIFLYYTVRMTGIELEIKINSPPLAV